jgi:diphosphomevalonate decarboxylase
MTSAVAVAHPNVALAKYWGKRARPGNFPAVPSLSVTLDGMTTRTRVTFDAALTKDEMILGGALASAGDHARASMILERVRRASNEKRFARVESANDFPTASGLASSASGYAALALAATAAAKAELGVDAVSDLARRGSASAARSLFGGFVELAAGAPDGDEEEILSARQLAPETALDVRVLACVVTESAKTSSSRDGMAKTAKESPYFSAWIGAEHRFFEEMKRALLASDLDRVGELTEQSTLAMHACAMSAGVVYVRGITLELFDAVRELRKGGAHAWATSDAGPHVKVLVSSKDAMRSRAVLEAVPGVLRVIESKPGGPARVVESVAS